MANDLVHFGIKNGPAPLSTSNECKQERDKLDFTIKITKEMASSGNVPRPVRVYADGVYDVFHNGHAQMLLQAKTCFPNVYLIAGVHSDEETHQRKGITVHSEAERIEAVRHCRYVDEVFPQAPWLTLPDWMEEYKIDFIAHDDMPYGGQGQNDIYAQLKANGQFIATKRQDGISTSDLISRVISGREIFQTIFSG